MGKSLHPKLSGVSATDKSTDIRSGEDRNKSRRGSTVGVDGARMFRLMEGIEQCRCSCVVVMSIIRAAFTRGQTRSLSSNLENETSEHFEIFR